MYMPTTATAEPEQERAPQRNRWGRLVEGLAAAYIAKRTEEGRPLDDDDEVLAHEIVALAVETAIAVHVEVARGGHPLAELVDEMAETMASANRTNEAMTNARLCRQT